MLLFACFLFLPTLLIVGMIKIQATEAAHENAQISTDGLLSR
jgi:hypothetical protein